MSTARVGEQADLSQGTKFDKGKLRVDLVAPEQILALAAVYTYGCRKYAERNWEKGMAWGRVFAAAMRHLWAWWGGKKHDPESKLPHLWHAFWGVGVLLVYECRGFTHFDDRSAGVDVDGLLERINAALNYPPNTTESKDHHEGRGVESNLWAGDKAFKEVHCLGGPALAGYGPQGAS